MSATQQVHLAYGRTGLDITIPADATVIESSYVAGLANEQAAIVNALRKPINSSPLAELARSGQTVTIVHTDITRATPNERILPPLLAELEDNGIKRENITLLNALGTHRPQTRQELEAMLGPEIVAHYRCLQHDGNDDANLVHVGKTRFGHDIRVNRQYMEADLRILTGFIEPHFFAGFSGGPKGVLPSIAGAESVIDNHGARMVGHPNATWGITDGNPIWEEMLEAAKMTQPTFLLNVTMNRDKQITRVFAGELEAAHRHGCAFVKEHAMAAVDRLFDIVVTSNSGYPLDLNLYQAIKGVSGAAQIVKPGGAIIIAAQCWDGIPEHGAFGRLLREADSADEILERVHTPGFSSPDQWQVQVQAMCLKKADIHIYAEALSDEQINQCLLKPCRSIEKTLEMLAANHSGPPSICVLPEGPLTIPYLKD